MIENPGVPLAGCRHDVLGHALKAIGILRAISECASPDDCDPSAEGWWDLGNGTFIIRSDRFPDADSLTEFFSEKYRPTPIIAAWNKSGGVTDKIDVEIAGGKGSIAAFRSQNEAQLAQFGLKKTKKVSKSGDLKFSTKAEYRPMCESLVVEFNGRINTEVSGMESAPLTPLSISVKSKTSGKKDGTLPKVAALMKSGATFAECLKLSRDFADELQSRNAQLSMLRYRDMLPQNVAECVDSLSAFHLAKENDNPLFGHRGKQGNTDIFRMFWEHYIEYRKHGNAYARASLFGDRLVSSGLPSPNKLKNKGDGKKKSPCGAARGKGTGYFPDAIKGYNQGLEWIADSFPFCPLDYLLAVEGALAMRGTLSKSMSANARSYAAFPFVFEGTEAMTDDENENVALGPSVWLPLWSQPTTFGELHSFLLDSQARLPKKDCRFASDFARAARCQGVDAGFAGFQEFRFKMKGARIPWAVSARFMPCSPDVVSGMLNELLTPVDESGFLDQFVFRTTDEVKRLNKPDHHPLRVPVLDAIEEAVAEPDANKFLNVLRCLADLNARLAKSKALREKIGAGRVTFVPPLCCDDWSEALGGLDTDPEFEIARALASLRGHERQADGAFSKVEPFLGSLLPLQRGRRHWFLPDPPSPQAVWTGIDLTRDLSAVLARRVIDSAADFRPALVGAWTASLPVVLAFLRGELDDHRIARLVEALSLIDWQLPSAQQREGERAATADENRDAIPVAYAAIRALVEVACDQDSARVANEAANSSPRAIVQRAISLATRQEPGMVVTGVSEALRRLAIVGVPNTYGEDSRRQKPKLAGRDVIAFETGQAQLQCDRLLSQRLAAAVLVPLSWRDRWKLFRAITLPQTTR